MICHFKRFDVGDILAQTEVVILPDETRPQLTHKMAVTGTILEGTKADCSIGLSNVIKFKQDILLLFSTYVIQVYCWYPYISQAIGIERIYK